MTKPAIYREQTVVIKEDENTYILECVEVPHRPRVYWKKDYTRESAFTDYCNNLTYYGVGAKNGYNGGNV